VWCTAVVVILGTGVVNASVPTTCPTPQLFNQAQSRVPCAKGTLLLQLPCEKIKIIEWDTKKLALPTGL
jgi:hypothetical protein